jgi:quinoprotein glucose dehydrogenase
MRRARIRRRATLWVAVVFLAATVLGGSALWQAVGLGHDLSIAGRAAVIARPDPTAGREWRAYGGDSGGSRYVAAEQITRDNVGDLEVAWHHRIGLPSSAELERWAFEATPILVDGRLVLCTPYSEAIALDPGTGKQIWRYDPGVARDRDPGNQYACRGVAYWDRESREGVCARRIFLGTADSRLIALDAATGRPCRGFGENGEVRIDPGPLDWPGEFQITSAPAIAGDVVIVGSAISDNRRVNAPSGAVRAFDVRTGAPVWQFDPMNGAGRHANVWSTMSVDPERGLVFVPTSSPNPDFFGGLRPGDNRHANSIVALEARTGKVAWAFQTVHHDLWDYDVPTQPGLYRVWRDGAWHDVVATVGKTGLVFVLDRTSGRPFLPVEERAVPQGGVPGEALSASQPFPTVTPPLVPDRFGLADSFGVTLWDRLYCAAALHGLRREGLFTPPSLDGTLEYPFSGGGANWGSMAFDPSRNLMVVNLSNAAHVIRLMPREEAEGGGVVFAGGADRGAMTGTPYAVSRDLLASPLGLPCNPPPWGVIAGVDLASGRIVWRRALGTTEDLAPGGIALPFGTPNFGGPMITAGDLVFIGAAMDNYLRALDVETGHELWRARLPAGGQATPMSYVWEGRQFVVIVAGGHAKSGTRRGDHVIAFALGS